MLYAFSRDGAVPGHKLWHRINPRTRTPTNSIWICAFLAFLAGVPSLREAGGFPATFFAIVSIGVIGLYIAYVIPVFLRLRQGESFQRGPWHLGRWSYLIGWIAVIWVAFISIYFLLPQFSPITWASFNYAPVALLLLMLFVFGYWFLSARKWFAGPKVQGTPEELAATARGQVWSSDRAAPEARLSWRTATGRYRVIGDRPDGGEPAEPTIEDAYLLMLGERALGQEDAA